MKSCPPPSAAESALRVGLGGIFATVEAYPELRTVETFQHLLARITGLENAIADRREFYNESVNVNNVRIEQFPDAVIANLERCRCAGRIPPVCTRMPCTDEWFRSNSWAICWRESPFCQRSHMSAFWLSV